jgi:hypothetical protein
LDFTDILIGGFCLNLSQFDVRPKLGRALILSLEHLVKGNEKISNMRSISPYVSSIFLFFEFLNENEFNNKISAIGEITTQSLRDWRSWLYSNPSFSHSSAKRKLDSFNVLIEQIRISENIFGDELQYDLELPVPIKGIYYDQKPIEPYSDNDLITIERACRKALWKTIANINKGWKLVETGKDPRIECGKLGCNSMSWRNCSNILWYIVNELDCNFKGMTWLRAQGHNQFVNATSQTGVGGEHRPYSLKTAYEALLPTTQNLLPFLVLLLIKTGLNLESILGLKRNCIVGYGLSSNFERIRYSKGRGSHDELERPFSNKGNFSPIKLIKAIILITEPLKKHVPEDEGEYLFIGLSLKNSGKRIIVWGLPPKHNEPHSGLSSYIANMFNRIDAKKGNGLFIDWKLVDDKKNQILFDSRRFRTSNIRDRYRSSGDLGFVSKTVAKHHGARGNDLTSRYYLNNEANKEVHEDAVSNAINEMVSISLRGKIINSDIPSEYASRILIQTIAIENDESEELIENILKGEQDVFIAHCRDFYNQPGGKKDSPCASPWMCFDCKNAIWTSRILPKLVAFLSFIEDQRELLGPEDWHSKFYKPWSVIKYAILPRFDTEKIEAAELLAVSQKLFIPTYWKVR